LVSSNRYADLCVSCHEKEGWTNSSHASSSARWNGNGNDPWLNADYDSVAENGCASCHRPHASAKGQRLLKHVFEEDTCLVCHNGNVASTDVETELTKQYVHPVQDYTDVHDPVEDFSSGNAQKHVECGDCHNPHQVGGVSSPGPPSGVPGANRGVKGINSVGRSVSQAQDLYEVCFKCHAGNNVKKNLPVTRGINQLNTSMEFSPGNPSYHPVMAPGVNPDVPSRSNIPNKQSRISCADCHNSDNPNGPKGPHGSSFKHLLERNYTTSDFTDESSYSYGLCYKCHDRNSIMSDESFTEHKKHIVDQKTPCSACHDPHGISSSQGNPINNSHLMNFDLTIVRQNGLGRMEFVDQGRFAGQCYLNCHGKEHGPQQYP
jgi:predicted CXXCH cytochrome family protein